MKLMALTIAGVVAASALAPVPASAQRWHDDRGWHEGRPGPDGRWHRPPPPRGYDRDHYRDGRRWHRGPRFRTVCRWQGGHYGRQKVCWRVRR